jgi:hypothetical protein
MTSVQGIARLKAGEQRVGSEQTIQSYGQTPPACCQSNLPFISQMTYREMDIIQEGWPKAIRDLLQNFVNHEFGDLLVGHS